MKEYPMKWLHIDVMTMGGVFLCTLHYRYNPVFKVSMEEIDDFVLSKRPSLRNKKYMLFMD